MQKIKENIDRILLVAILIVGLIGVFGSKSGGIGAVDFGTTSVTDANAIITGTLAVTGATTISNNLTVTGTTTLSGTLSGFATSSLTSLTVSGATNLAIVTSTHENIVNGTATSTISIGKTGVGKICQYNGSNYTITSFAANSITPIIATSTTCQ